MRGQIKTEQITLINLDDGEFKHGKTPLCNAFRVSNDVKGKWYDRHNHVKGKWYDRHNDVKGKWYDRHNHVKGKWYDRHNDVKGKWYDRHNYDNKP